MSWASSSATWRACEQRPLGTGSYRPGSACPACATGGEARRRAPWGAAGDGRRRGGAAGHEPGRGACEDERQGGRAGPRRLAGVPAAGRKVSRGTGRGWSRYAWRRPRPGPVHGAALKVAHIERYPVRVPLTPAPDNPTSPCGSATSPLPAEGSRLNGLSGAVPDSTRRYPTRFRAGLLAVGRVGLASGNAPDGVVCHKVIGNKGSMRSWR